MSRRALLLVNPNAGRVDDATIGSVCRAAGADVRLEVAVTHTADEVPGVLERLDGRPLLLLGGDGTLHVALAALHRRGDLAAQQVGFLPAGTANAFARAMGLPLEPAKALARVRDAGGSRIDLLESSSGHIAVNDLHTGLGIPATHRSARLKPLIGPLAYPVANTIAGLRSDGWRVSVVVDGTPLTSGEEPVLAVAIGNSSLIGDGTPLWPAARVDDARADVVVFMAADRAERVRAGLAVQRGRHRQRPSVRSAQGAEIELAGDVPGHNADGELVEDAGPATWRVLPGAWCLLS